MIILYLIKRTRKGKCDAITCSQVTNSHHKLVQPKLTFLDVLYSQGIHCIVYGKTVNGPVMIAGINLVAVEVPSCCVW